MKLITLLLGGLSISTTLLIVWAVAALFQWKSGEVLTAPVQATDVDGCYWIYSARFKVGSRGRVYEVVDRVDTVRMQGRSGRGVGPSKCTDTKIKIGSRIKGPMTDGYVTRRTLGPALILLPLIIGVAALTGRGAWLAQRAPHRFPGMKGTLGSKAVSGRIR